MQETLVLHAFLRALSSERVQQYVPPKASLSMTAAMTEANQAEAILTTKSFPHLQVVAGGADAVCSLGLRESFCCKQGKSPAPVSSKKQQ